MFRIEVKPSSSTNSIRREQERREHAKHIEEAFARCGARLGSLTEESKHRAISHRAGSVSR
jgi:hypothetical protein